MPFLLPLLPAVAAGAVSTAGVAGLNALLENGGQKGSGFQAQGADIQTPVTGQQVMAGQAPVQDALTAQQQLVAALRAQNGIGNQADVYNQLQGVVNGTGPNPAKALLAQATGQNVAAQGALAAGQRGASSNVGLIQRQAAQQGANAQQTAAGQGASLQAQQSLNALEELGNIAGQQVGNEMAATGNYNQFTQGNQRQLFDALNAQNTAQIQNAGQQNSANATVANTNANNQGKAIGGVANALGETVAKTGLFGSPKSVKTTQNMAKGGKVKNPIPRYVYPKELQQLAAIYHGKPQNLFEGGEATVVPGKAKVHGDHKKNDTVPAKLSPGEVVLPRSVMNSKDPAGAAAKFVAAIQKKEGKGRPENDFKQALRRAVQNRKLKAA